MTTPTDSTLPALNASEKNEVTVGRGILCLQGEGVDFVGKRASGAYHSFSDWDNDQRWSECPVVPRDCVSRRVERDGPHWHLTIATKRELNGIKYPPEDKADNPTTDRERVCDFCRSFLDGNTERDRDWFVLGIGRAKAGCHESFFLVCCYPKAAALRRRLGLPPKDFHISLGFRGSDAHACGKGARSLLLPQPRSMAGLRTTATELVEAARTAFWETKPRKYHQTEVLLDTSEAIIGLRNLRGNPISSKSFDLVSCLDTPDLNLIRDILQMRCQLLGRKREFDSVVEKASLLLDVQKIIDETLKEASTMTSIALGYKGVALSMLKKWKEAYPCLLSSYELYHQRPHSKTTERTTTRTLPPAIRRKEEEEATAIHIERRLMNCCKVLGYECPLPPLTSFPRIPHLFDAGGTAVSNDDLVISGDSSLFHKLGNGSTEVIVEEKIDGANMGFSLSGSGEIIAQNRSHFISKGDHRQFGPLTSWVQEHRTALKTILASPNNEQIAPSQGLVLFGEWCVARHSIQYDKLPGYFVAFDLYDRVEKKFYSRKRFHSILSNSGIPCAPIITVRKFGPYPVFKKSGENNSRKVNAIEADLRSLLDAKSKFRTCGGVEGVVLRIEDDDAEWLMHRAKIVRPDFVSGIEGHWMRRDIEKQIIDRQFGQEYCSTESYPLAQSLREHELCSHETINPRRKMVASTRHGDIVLPRNFSFLWKDEVVLSSTPTSASQILACKEKFNTSLVVTLTEEEPLPESWFRDVECTNLFVPVPNYHPPSRDQMDEIADAIEKVVASGGSTIVHCGGGKGRAGTVGACLLLKFGELGIRATRGDDVAKKRPTQFSSTDATKYIKRIRPGSIETTQQESFIRKYADLLWERITLPEFDVDESTSVILANVAKKEPLVSKKATIKAERDRLMMVKKIQRRAPKVIVCMGLPGSGKSTFARRLAESPLLHSNNTDWLVINQDKLGRKECERLAGNSKNKRVILDRCNATESERARWLKLMHSPPKGETALVFFSANAGTCTSRVENRTDHETIPKGRGHRIVSEMAKRLEPPTVEEKKRFGSIHVIHTFKDADELLRSFGA